MSRHNVSQQFFRFQTGFVHVVVRNHIDWVTDFFSFPTFLKILASLVQVFCKSIISVESNSSIYTVFCNQRTNAAFNKSQVGFAASCTSQRIPAYDNRSRAKSLKTTSDETSALLSSIVDYARPVTTLSMTGSSPSTMDLPSSQQARLPDRSWSWEERPRLLNPPDTITTLGQWTIFGTCFLIVLFVLLNALTEFLEWFAEEKFFVP